MAHTETPTVLTVPNLVSTSRVILAVGFLAMEAVPVRLALIAVASLTDFLDGWIARRTKVVSRFGALIDPVADRFFVLCVVIAYVLGDQLTVWQAVAIFFRDIMSLIGWFVARNVSWLRPIRFRARPLGKIDWIFTRGLLADEPTVLPALCPDGTPSSDHEGLFVRVRLAQN